MHGADDQTDPSAIAGLRELTVAMEDSEVELRERTRVLRAEMRDLAARTAYLSRLSELLAELLPLVGDPASPNVERLRIAVVDLRASLRGAASA